MPRWSPLNAVVDLRAGFVTQLDGDAEKSIFDNAAAYQLPKPPRYALSNEGARKSWGRTLAEHGLAVVSPKHGRDAALGVTMDTLPSLLLLLGNRGAAMEVSMADAGVLYLFSNQVAETAERGSLPDEIMEPLRRRAGRLESLLAVIAENYPGDAEGLSVFGSLTGTSRYPADIDLVIDMTASNGSWLGDRAPNWLLMMAHKHYGSIDPFVDANTGLWVRDDNARNYVEAKHAKMMRPALDRRMSMADCLAHRRALADGLEAAPSPAPR